MTAVKEGGFYGWPYSYFGLHLDPRVSPQRPDLVSTAIVPDYALGPHTAALGLAFYDGTLLPKRYFGGAFVGQHGSWNRTPRSGYKVIFVPFEGGRPSGQPEDVLTGFLSDAGDAQGRPVGVAIDKSGALLVADDVGNTIWRVTRAAPQSAATTPRRYFTSNAHAGLAADAVYISPKVTSTLVNTDVLAEGLKKFTPAETSPHTSCRSSLRVKFVPVETSVVCCRRRHCPTSWRSRSRPARWCRPLGLISPSRRGPSPTEAAKGEAVDLGTVDRDDGKRLD